MERVEWLKHIFTENFKMKKSYRTAKVMFCDAPRTAQIAFFSNPEEGRRQLWPSSLGTPDATSKVPFPLLQTETRQHKRNKDVASDFCLGCSCWPWAGADSLVPSKALKSRDSQSGTDAAPCRAPVCSYTPVAALSALSSVWQGCRSYPPKGPVAPHPGNLPCLLRGEGCSTTTCKGCRGYFGPPRPCRAPGGGAATLASAALHFDTMAIHMLGEAKPRGFQMGGFPTFFGKGPDCVADPFGTVPRRCC